MNLFSILLFLLLLLAGCSKENDNQSSTSANANCETITAENADQCLRLNHIQVLGTHNSYKQEPADALIKEFNKISPGWAKNLEYHHKELAVQFEELNIRQIELDVFSDPQGGLFAYPFGAKAIKDTAFIRPEAMLKPGFKVLHIQDIDYRSNCLRLVDCLTEVRDWSLKNPQHLPIMILLEMKDSTPDPVAGWKFTEAFPIDKNNINEVDAEIWSVFSKNHVITPDDVRGDYSNLEEAILDKGWPTLAQSRGKVLFALDNTGTHKEAYLSQSPNLKDRAMFVSSLPGNPTAGFIKMNDVLEDKSRIAEYVEKGYIVRTRTDVPTVEARTGSVKRRDWALESGAQYLSTDYPEPSPFDTTYIVTFPNTSTPGRCNPVSAPDSCQNAWLSE